LKKIISSLGVIGFVVAFAGTYYYKNLSDKALLEKCTDYIFSNFSSMGNRYDEKVANKITENIKNITLEIKLTSDVEYSRIWKRQCEAQLKKYPIRFREIWTGEEYKNARRIELIL